MSSTRTAIFWASAVAAGLILNVGVDLLFPEVRWAGPAIGGGIALVGFGMLISAKLKR
ncbi:hypothetical protein [Caulobacter sp. Root655]|uniref:hypothetical protein n=1 Tax=Caulobacter sp. Root655 TaxID=1736578 RepID=UPI000A9DA50B|nr:hypothetical protein [Caulobacter sp. Root655]